MYDYYTTTVMSHDKERIEDTKCAITSRTCTSKNDNIMGKRKSTKVQAFISPDIRLSLFMLLFIVVVFFSGNEYVQEFYRLFICLLPLGIQIMAWDQHNNLAGLNRLMGSQPYQIVLIRSPTALQI